MFPSTNNFIFSQQIEKRALITLRTLDAAKTAKIKYIIFLSVFCAEMNDMIVGGQFKPLEAKIMCMDVSYTIVSNSLMNSLTQTNFHLNGMTQYV